MRSRVRGTAGRSAMTSERSAAAWRCAAIAVAVVAIEILCRVRVIPPLTMPPPSAIVVDLWAILLAGKANAAIAAFLAERLGVPRGAITLERGDSSRKKLFRVRGAARDARRSRAGFVDLAAGAMREAIAATGASGPAAERAIADNRFKLVINGESRRGGSDAEVRELFDLLYVNNLLLPVADQHAQLKKHHQHVFLLLQHLLRLKLE